MPKKKKETVELRVYEVPQGHSVLALYGDSWIRTYGHEGDILHFHNLMEIGICRYGAGQLKTVDGNYEYSDGTFTILPENYPHVTYSYGTEENFWEYLFFDLDDLVNKLYPNSPVYANEVIQALNAHPEVYSRGEHPELSTIVDSIIKECIDKNHYHHQVIELYMKILITYMMRLQKEVPYYADGPATTRNPDQIMSAIDYITKNLDQPIRVVDLADICNMSETHFRRIFQEYVDMPPMDYVNLIRIQKACELLKKGSESMEYVAEKCGFISISTFNRNFKKFLGTTPYQWKIDPDNYEGKLNKYHISPKQGW